MGTFARTLISVATCVLLPAAVQAQRVTYDDYGTKNFSNLKTFGFKAASPDTDKTTPTGTTYDDPFVTRRTQDAITAQLTARGMTRNDEQPDIYVITRRTFKDEVLYYPYSWDWGYPYGYGWSGAWGWGWGPYSSYPVEIIRGTLIVDMQDAATGHLLWRGVAQRDLHPMSNPEHRTKRVNREVAKIFKKFPSMDAVGTSGHDVPKPR
jgi:hypothetical protein